jgi:uncharacterized membrane protein YgdD (TMEM256/DUF423 family)
MFLRFAAIAGALGVIAGAMLAHQLKKQMPEQALEIFETAVRYQFYHVFALLATGILSEKFPGALTRQAGNFFIAGILLFSGSLYLISAMITLGKNIPFAIGMLTPLGGVAFILGWIFLSISVGRRTAS